jgi:hypothetical protein
MMRCLNRFLLWVAQRIIERLGRVAENTTDSRLLDSLAEVRYDEILTPVLLNRATRPETLCAILDDECYWGGEEEARVHVSYNSALPLSRLVEVMRRDESEYVRVAAACALSERLSADSSPDAHLVSECREFLMEVHSRTDEHDNVEKCLELLGSFGIGVDEPS